MFTRATPCEKGHSCASSEMVDNQIWKCHTRFLNGTGAIHLLGKKKKTKEMSCEKMRN
jgi:hypothetical protein